MLIQLYHVMHYSASCGKKDIKFLSVQRRCKDSEQVEDENKGKLVYLENSQ